MNATFEIDDRGLVRACPQCGQLNRLTYQRLGQQQHVFRCPQCQTELKSPTEPLEVTSAEEFDALMAGSALPVLVDFWAPWCGPCRMVAPELNKVAAEGENQWLVAKVNIDQVPEVANRFRVQSIPTLAVFLGGREVKRNVGGMMAYGMMSFLQEALDPQK